MSGFRRLLVLALVAASSSQCLLVTESVNMPPSVQLVAPEAMVMGREAVFAARGQDPEQAVLQYQWFRREPGQAGAGAPCPRTLAEAATATERPLGDLARPEEMKFVPRQRGGFCVWVVVRDRDGASAFAGDTFTIGNQTPRAEVKLAPGSVATAATGMMGHTVPLYSEVRVVGSSEDDDPEESRRYAWEVEPPAEGPEPERCGQPEASAREHCRRLTAPGLYRFKLRVRDAESESPAEHLEVTALPDALPCIDRTEPPHDLAPGPDALPVVVASPAEPFSFRVLLVKDDGDPFPTATGVATGTFTWHYQVLDGSIAPEKAELRRLAATNLSTLTFERDRFRFGDELVVQLQYRDRQEAPTSQRCGRPEDQATCDDGQSRPRRCLQRVSWKVRFLR